MSTGAENDLELATNLARSVVGRFGMGESVRLLHCATPQAAGGFPEMNGPGVRDCSERTASLLDEEAEQLLEQLYQDARQLLQLHKDALERVAEALVERENLDEFEFQALLVQPSPSAPRAPILSS